MFEITAESITCSLPAHPRHEALRELAAIENKLILGHRDDALNRLESLIELDPLNYRALELYSEACALAQVPGRLAAFVLRKGIQPSQLNNGTVVLIAQAVLLDRGNPTSTKLAQDWLDHASKARLEIGEVRRIAVSYRKLGRNEEAIELIDGYFQRLPAEVENSTLLDIRAKAKMDLAKRCIETARESSSSGELRARAWQQARAFLESAEQDLQRALATASPKDREYVLKDLEFLQTMKSFATRPPPARPRRRSGRSDRPRPESP